jgi:hypothetical protein
MLLKQKIAEKPGLKRFDSGEYFAKQQKKRQQEQQQQQQQQQRNASSSTDAREVGCEVAASAPPPPAAAAAAIGEGEDADGSQSAVAMTLLGATDRRLHRPLHCAAAGGG